MRSRDKVLLRLLAAGALIALVAVAAGAVGGRLPGKIPPILLPPVPPHVVNVAAEGIFHFPLQVGNEWTYERRNTFGAESIWRAAVTRRAEGASPGFVLEGYFGDRRIVDFGPGGEVLEIGSDGQTYLWYRLGTNVGTKWTQELPENGVDCVGGSAAVLASHTEFVRVPAGEFPDAVRVDYASRSLDAGLVTEWFAAGVGLVKRVESSLAGPIESVLLRAKVGGIVLPDHPTGTSLTLAEVRYVEEEEARTATVEGTFRVHDQTSDPLTFAFEGCVSASAKLVDDWGNRILEIRVDGGGCCMCEDLVQVELHGETLSLPFKLDLVGPGGSPLPEGHYSLIVTLDSSDAAAVRPSATAHLYIDKR